MSAASPDPLVEQLMGVAPTVSDPDVCAAYGMDWTRRFSGPVRAVVRPTAVAEVVAALRVCAAAGVPVVPQGGNSSIVGGSVPGPSDPPSVVLSLTGLNQLGPIDELGGSVTAGAGVTLADLHAHAGRSGMVYGVDLAARDSATVGGTIATNAGGIRVCAYGMTRAQVLGVECVLSDGSVLSRLVGLPKDNTGYDFGSLMAGSEGTLGVITAARLRLRPAPPPTMVLMTGVRTLRAALALAHSCVPVHGRLLGAEVVDAEGLQMVCDFIGEPAPIGGDWPYLLLVEATELDPPEDLDAVLGLDAGDRRRLWRYREDMSEAVSALGVAHKLDVSVPLANLDAMADGVRAIVPAQARVSVFGHLADGNLHIEITGADPDDESLDRAIFDLATGLGGAVSAEHGVGRAKSSWLGLSRTAAEIDAMHRIKNALDPAGILNPGALPPPAR
jgi:FAD/FMN-containing dehydrogenase